MNIDFNNVRLQACYAYDRLVMDLNRCNSYEGYLLVDPKNLEKELNDLRMVIGSIAMTFEEGNPDFKDVYEQEYPEGNNMQVFEYGGEDED